MARFHDTLGSLDDAEGVSLPEGFGESISTAYDDDLNDIRAEATLAAQADIATMITDAVTQAVDAAVTAIKAEAAYAMLNADSTGDGADELGGDVADTEADLPDDLQDLDYDASPVMGLFDKKEG